MGIYLDVCFRCSWKKEGNGRIKCMIFFFKGRGLGFCCFGSGEGSSCSISMFSKILCLAS